MYFLKKTLIVITLALYLVLPNLSYANAMTDTITEIGDNTGLTNYEGDIHQDAIDKRGVRNITSGLFYVLDFGKYALATILVLVLIYAGIRMAATSDTENSTGDAKKYFTSALIGILLIFIAPIAVKNVFFGESGDKFNSVESAQQAAIAGSDEVRGIYTFIEMFLAAIAVLTIIISGVTIVVSKEDISEPQKHIVYACAGLVLVGLSEVFIKDFIFDDHGSSINIDGGKNIFVLISNFAISFISIISVGAFVYGGYLYVGSMFGDDQAEKAKKAMIGAIIGILIAAGSYAISKTLLNFEDTADEVSLRMEEVVVYEA